MLAYAADWMNILTRWFHLIVGIGWIGTSFFFVALDVSFRREAGNGPGVAGSAWLVHGGSFYHVDRYTVAPPVFPAFLKWYKWDAYLTFVSGIVLLSVQYWLNARAYLIDPKILAMDPWMAIAISIVSLTAGWLIYDAICRSPLGRTTLPLAAVVFALIVGAAWGFTHVYSGRGALIHVGAFVGTIMAANVFRVIIPGQRRMVEQLIAGETPDARLGAIAKQRSVHNTYLTLPVLLMMVSNHYPVLTNHPQSWLLVALILVIGGPMRHFIVRHEAGDSLVKIVWAPALAALGLVAALILTAPKAAPTGGAVVSDAAVLALTAKHCTMCHAERPTHEGFTEAPKGVTLGTAADLARFAPLIKAQAIDTDAMPLGNETGITDAERALLGAWVAAHP
ncbi:cysteine desulfurase [Siculibacillus lacustris]|uniref:Cysteine desulfurase n=1 Tax=Siculibacillus lacustris TaxID=1549641 RepID=A0A4Q9VQQ9_9HYPH|nr:urate hydroxylase PuuD [Siculibacillus lacustris]TBW37192.1 cysteine desulfurase [Siculibacillus lacustris]